MYCKNCGEEIDERAAICVKCGFANGVGEKFCGHCGKEVEAGQTICMGCGFYLNEVKEEKSQANEKKTTVETLVTEHRESVRKTLLFSIVKSGITLALILGLLFLPIFRCERSVSGMSLEELAEIKDVETLGKMLETGKIEKSFSLFDDLKMLADVLFDGDGEAKMIIALEEGLFPLFTLIMMIMLAVMSIKQILAKSSDLKDLEKTTLLRFNELKKSGDTKKKSNPWRQQTVYALFMYMVFDVVFAKVFGELFGQYATVRNMQFFSGVSGWIVLVALLLVAYVFVDYQAKKIDRALLLHIAEQEYAG